MALISIDLLLLILLIFILIVTLKFISKQPASRLDNIPGPRGYPIVGSLFKLSPKTPHLSFTELSKIYGNVYRISLGGLKCVVLNGHKTIQEALGNQTIAFAGRANLSLFKILADNGIFALMDYSPKFKLYRKLVVRGINHISSPHIHTDDYKAGLNTVSRNFVNNMLLNKGKPCDPLCDLKTVVFLFISSFSFGRKFTKLDETILNFFKDDKETAKKLAMVAIADFFPLFKPFIGSISTIKNIIENEIESVNKMFKERLKMDRDVPIECVADAFAEYSKHDDLKNEMGEKVTHYEILCLILTLFFAGIDTTINYIMYCILYIIIFPKHQSNIQLEIDQIMSENKNKIPSIEDIERMPKLKAFMLETERFSVFLPFLLSRHVTRDTILQSFFLPKGTIIIPNIYSAHFDPLVWKNPNQFDPTRFLTKDGNTIDSNIANDLLLFGAGRRRCPGQYMARLNIAVMLAHLFQKCNIELAPGEKIDPTNIIFNFFSLPLKHFKIVVSTRK